jgi:hypothetical protein
MSNKKSDSYYRGKADWSANKYNEGRPGLFMTIMNTKAENDAARRNAEEYREGWYDKDSENKPRK